MNVYFENNSRILYACDNTLDENGKCRSIFYDLKYFCAPGLSECLLTRDLFKKYCIYQYSGKLGTMKFEGDSKILYNKGIVYYINENACYYDYKKKKDMLEYTVVEGLYKNDKTGKKVFEPNAIIEVSCDIYSANFDAQIYEVGDTREIQYLDNNLETNYKWNDYVKINLHKRNDEYFSKRSLKFSPFMDKKVKNYTMKLENKLKEE